MPSPSEFVISLGVEFDVPEQELQNLTRTLETKLKKSAKIELITEENKQQAIQMYQQLWKAAKVEAEKYLSAVESGNTKVQRQALRDMQALQAEMNRLYNASSKSSIKGALTRSVKEERKAYEEIINYHNSLDRQIERSATQQTKLEKQKQKEAKETTKVIKEQTQAGINAINQQLANRRKAEAEETKLAQENARLQAAFNQAEIDAKRKQQVEADRYIASLDRQADKITSLIYYLEKNAQAIDEVERQYKQGNITFEQASERLDRLRTSQESLIQRTERTKSSVDKLNREFIESGNTSTEAKQKYEQLRTSLNNLDKKAEEATSSFNRFNNVIGEGKGGWFKQFATGFKQGLGEIGGMAVGAKAASEAISLMVQGLHMAVEEVVELNKEMTDVQMVAGATDEQAMKMFGDYNQLAKDLSVTTKDVINGASEWLRQGRSQAETMDLIKASTIQATLANLSYEESTTLLTSTLNGYKMDAEDAIHIIDALVQVDFKAATSVQELATALQKTANTARTSGVDFERLVGYIGAVSESTRQAPELIGRAFRTMFSRMQSVAAGKDIDETGESLNDVEKVLNSLGIKLRDTNSTFRDMSDVLDDIHDRWTSFNDVQRQQIATSVAGKNQMEIFLALMENYDKALVLEQEALNSNGAAMERYAIYQESIAAKMNELKAAFEEFVYSEDFTEFLKQAIELGTNLIGLLNLIAPALELLIKPFNTLFDLINGTIDLFKGKSTDEKISDITSAIEETEQRLKGVQENPLDLKADEQAELVRQLEEELDNLRAKLAKEEGSKRNEGYSTTAPDSISQDNVTLENFLEIYKEINKQEEQTHRNTAQYYEDKNIWEEEYQEKIRRGQRELAELQTWDIKSPAQGNEQAKQILYWTKYIENARAELNRLNKDINDDITYQSSLNKSFSDSKKALIEWAKETYNSIKALEEHGVTLSEEEKAFVSLILQIDEIRDTLPDYNDKLVENTNNLEDNANASNDATSATFSLKESLKLLNDTINQLDSEQKAINEALEQFQAEGGLSAQTALNLVDANEKFASALEFVDGKIKLNINSLQNLAQQSKITAVEALASASNMVEGYQAVAQAMIMVSSPGSLGNDPYWEEKYGYGVLNSSVNKGSTEAFKKLQASIQSILNYSYGSLGNISNYRPSGSGSSSGGSSSDKDDSQKEYEQALKDKQDLFKTYLKYITESIDKEIDAIKKEQDAWDKFYDDKIDEIKEIEDARDEELEKEEKLLNIEKLRAELAKANQQVVRVYLKNQGFVYRQDTEAIASAQDKLNIALKEYEEWQHKNDIDKQIQDLEDAKDKVNADLDEEIKKLEELKDKWSESLDITDDTDKYKDILDDIKEFEDANYDERLDMLEEFIEEYKKLLDELSKIKPSYGGGGSGSSGGGWSVGTGAGGTIVIKPPVVENPRVPNVTPGSPNYVGPSTPGYVPNPDTGGDPYDYNDDYRVPSSGSSSGSSSSSNKDYNEDYRVPSGSSSSGSGSSSNKDYNEDYRVPSNGSSSSKPSSGHNPSTRPGTVEDLWYSASGRTFVSNDHLSMVGEEGPELRVLHQGDGIVPANMTENLMEWGRYRPEDIFGRGMEFETVPSGGNSEVYNMNFDSIILPDVDDFYSFKNALMNESRNYAIQIQSKRT